jgi:hypothetical protein
MPKDLSAEDAATLGYKFSGRQMDNGELRFSINNVDTESRKADGSAYILTIMPPGQAPAWQNAHYHGGKLLAKGDKPLTAGIAELILVKSGFVVSADQDQNGKRTLGLYEPGESFVSQPGVPHNIFQAGTTHCIKFGEPVGNFDEQRKGADWWPAPDEFDAWTKSFEMAGIFKQLGLSQTEIDKYTKLAAAA